MMKIRILHVVAYPPYKIGGLMLYVQRLAKYQKKLGFEVAILSSDLEKPYYHEITYDGIQLFNLKNYGHFANMNPMFNPIPFLKKNGDKYDIIHTHSYIHFSTIITVLWAYLHKKKCVLTLHGGVKTKEYSAKTLKEAILVLFKNLFFDKLIGRMTLKFPDALISVAKEDLLEINNIFAVNRKKNNFWIPNGVDKQFHDYQTPIESDDIKNFDINSKERKYLTFIGRLSYVKGFDAFLHIAKNLNKNIPNIPIFILGRGEMENLIYEAKKELNITYIKSVPCIKNIYQQSLFYILTSRSEGLPTTILEAMLTRTPVICTTVGGIIDIVKDYENAFIIDIEHIEDTTTKIMKIMNDKKLIEQVVNNAEKMVHQQFLWDAIAKKNILVYKKIIKS